MPYQRFEYTHDMSETDKLKRLANGVRAMGPFYDIRFVPSKDNPEHWAILVGVQDAVVLNTDFGLLENVIELAISKLAGISQRALKAVKPEE